MTPKAPPDIDLYVVNPPVSNTKKTHLLIRHSIFAAKKMIIKRSPMLGSTVPRYDGSAAGLLAGHEFAIAIFILALIYIFHPQLKYILVEIFWLSTRPYTRGFLQKPTPTILMCQLAVWIVTLVTTVYTLLLLYQALFYMPTGWAATSEFLTTCKALQVRRYLLILSHMLNPNRIRTLHLGRIVQSILPWNLNQIQPVTRRLSFSVLPMRCLE